MILKTGSVLLPKENGHWNSKKKFIVERFDVMTDYVRVIDKNGWWIGSEELDNYIVEDK